MASRDPNLLLKTHHLPYLAGGLAIVLTVAVSIVSVTGLLPGRVLAAAPTFSGGGPTDGATGQATDVTVSIVSDIALNPATLGTFTGQTSGTTNQLGGLDCVSTTTCWTSGVLGTVLRTTDSGTTWTQRFGTANQDLRGLDAIDANTAWVAGTGGTIQKTTNGGSSWATQTSGTSSDFLQISAASTDVAWAVGDAGMIRNTTDGGTTWSAQTSGTSNILFGVYALTTSTAWAVGNSGTIVKTTNGGSTWTAQTSGVSSSLRAVYAIDGNTAYIATDGGAVLKTTDGGTNWTAQATGVTTALQGIHCSDSSTCWAVGDGGTVRYTADGGTNWYGQASNTSNNLKDISAASASAVWFSGDGGMIGVFGYTNVLLRANTGNTQGGSPSGTNLCASVTLSNSDRTITCGHAPLSQNTWYTLTLVGGSGGIANTSSEVLAANVTRAFRTIGAPALSTASISDFSFANAADSALTLDLDNPIAATSLINPVWGGPSPMASNLNGVHCFDANRCVAVGDSSTAMTTSDGGTNWFSGGGGSTVFNAAGAYSGSAVTVWRVGNSGVIQRNRDGGFGTWTILTSGTTQNLKAVQFADANIGWAVGAAGTILKTTDGGSTWSAQTSGTTEILFGLHVVDASTVYAVGNSGTVKKTTNGGTTWTTANTGATVGNHGDIHCVSATTCWIASDTGLVYRTTDGGVSWTAATPELNITWNGIHFASATTGWVVGSSAKLYKSVDGGVTWTQQTVGTSRNLAAISCTDANTCVVAGATGLIIRTSDGGTTWTIQAAGANVTMNHLKFADTSTGWAVGASGTIVKSGNGGATWVAQTSGTTNGLEDVDASSTTVVWAVGDSGTIRKTTDGGTSWASQTSGTSENLHGVNVLNANTVYASGGSATSAVVLKTTDGGSTWTNVTPSGLTTGIQDTYVVDANTVYAVGLNGVIRKTTDGGTSWSSLTSGTSNSLNGITCTDANTCWVVGSSGTILKTTDGGSWSAQTSGVTAHLTSVRFADSNVGYITGTSGTLLKTATGGTGWAVQTTNTTNNLNGIDLLSGGAGAVIVGHSATVMRSEPNLILQAHTSNGRSGALNSSNLCTSISIGADGSGNSNRRLTCGHGTLACGTWYTLKLVGGSAGVATTGGHTMSDATTTRSFRTAFCSNQAFDDPTLSSLASEGYLTINSGSSTAAAQATFAALMRSRVSTADGTVLVTVPQNAVFTRSGGGTFDTTALALSDYTSSATNVPGTKKAVIQYGVSGVPLTSSTAITISIPVASTVTDGTTLDVYRDLDGDFSDATTRLTTCTVSSSACSFTTTSLSYFAAAEPLGSPTQTDTTPPSKPTNLSCTSGASTATCTWTDPLDTDLASVRILLQQGEVTYLRGTVAKDKQTFTDPNTDTPKLEVGKAYTYVVQAVDTSGNRSADSTAATVTIASAPAPAQDTTPPGPVTNLQASSAGGKVTLTWADPTDADLKLLRVLLLRGEATSIRSVLNKGLQTFTDAGADLVAGIPVTFAVEAEDQSGNKSSRKTVTITVESGTAPTAPPTTPSPTKQPSTNEAPPPTADTTPPGAPIQPKAAVANDGKVTLTWTDPKDPDLAKVRILLIQGEATTLRDTVTKGIQTFTDPAADLTPGTTHTFALEAEDTTGNRSPKATLTVAIPARQTAPTEPDQPAVIPPEPRPPEPPPDLSAFLTTAPCDLTAQERTYLADAFTRSQGRSPATGGDLQFLCALRADPTNPVDPTKAFPKFRNLKAEELALRNFVNFFGRPPSLDTRDQPLPTDVAERDWWAVKYMAYHLRLAPTARDLDGERTCLKLFLDRDVDLYKDGTKERKPRGTGPKDLFDYDFIRACTYSGAAFLERGQ